MLLYVNLPDTVSVKERDDAQVALCVLAGKHVHTPSLCNGKGA